MKNKSGQQEMIGFVLIVVLVVIGLMIFLVISLRGDKEVGGNIELENLLSSVTRHTTDCIVSYDYKSVRRLVRSCYEGDDCKNLNKNSCDYMEETLTSILSDLFATEGSISSYGLDIFVKEGERILLIEDGNCNGTRNSVQESVSTNTEEKVILKLSACY